MRVVPGHTTTGGPGAWSLYLYRSQGQVNTRRNKPGVGGQQLHDLGSSRSLARVSAPAGGQQRTPEEKMLLSTTETGHTGAYNWELRPIGWDRVWPFLTLLITWLFDKPWYGKEPKVMIS